MKQGEFRKKMSIIGIVLSFNIAVMKACSCQVSIIALNAVINIGSIVRQRSTVTPQVFVLRFGTYIS